MPRPFSRHASLVIQLTSLLGLLLSVACGGAPTPTTVAAPSPTQAIATQPTATPAPSPSPTVAPTPISTPTSTTATHPTPTMGHAMPGTPMAMATPPGQNEFRGDSLVIRNVWARAATKSDNVSAVFMLIENTGDQPDRLLHAHCGVAEAVEIHESKMEGGIMKMQPVDGIDVPAHGTVELKPGGLHVMLIGLTRDLNPGDTIEVELHFEHAGHVMVEATVTKP